MASPQLENGHLKIANELIEAILSADLGRREQKVVWAVIRKTYGYNKKADAISTSQIAALTGIDRAHVARTLRGLITRNIITAGRSGVTRHGIEVQSLGLNKDHESWQTGAKTAPVKPVDNPPERVPKQHGCQNSTGADSARVTGAKTAAETGAKTAPTKDSKDRKTERGHSRTEKDRTGGNGHGSRIPEDFTLSQERQQAAEKQGLRPSEAIYEMEKFRDYWQAQPGQRGRKADWEATWRNWCRRSVEMRGREAGSKDSSSPMQALHRHCKDGHGITQVEAEDPKLASVVRELGGMRALRDMSERDFSRLESRVVSLYRAG